MTTDIMNYITAYRVSAAACRVCEPGHTCIEHTCIDCGGNHAPAASCTVDVLGR